MTILKEYRINNDMVQKEMADKLNCSLPSYRLYENGKKTIPHEVLIRFLEMRGEDSDNRIAQTLKELLYR